MANTLFQNNTIKHLPKQAGQASCYHLSHSGTKEAARYTFAQGGAIFIDDHRSGTDLTPLNITNCTFLGNDAGAGEAVFWKEALLKPCGIFSYPAKSNNCSQWSANSVICTGQLKDKDGKARTGSSFAYACESCGQDLCRVCAVSGYLCSNSTRYCGNKACDSNYRNSQVYGRVLDNAASPQSLYWSKP